MSGCYGDVDGVGVLVLISVIPETYPLKPDNDVKYFEDICPCDNTAKFPLLKRQSKNKFN